MTDKEYRRAVTAAGKAAAAGDLAEVRKQVERWPDLLAEPDIILKACAYGHFDTVRWLLDSGVDPMIRGKMGRPLDRTCSICSQTPWSEGHERIIELLIERGAEVHARGRFDLSPLAVTARHGDPAPVEILRRHGAFDRLELQDACALGARETVEAKLNDDPGSARRPNGFGWTPIYLAASTRWHRNFEGLDEEFGRIAERLIDAGALGDKNPLGIMAAHDLYAAASYGPPAIARVLLARGGDPEAIFRRALSANRVELAAEVPAGRRDLEAIADEKSGNRHLAEALRQGNLEAAEWLLAHGADATAVNRDGWTPLHFAVRRGVRDNLVQALLAAGADPNAADPEGLTPLRLAREKKRKSLIPLLESV